MRKAALILVITLLIALIALSLTGCGERKVEDIYGLDFNSPDYVRVPISNFSEKIANFTPTSRKAAERLDENDLAGALEILYRSIVESDPASEDQFFFMAIRPDWQILFYDPKLIFDLYRDRDRSGWSEDEKAAADLIVALAYEYGGYAGAVEEDLSQGEGHNTDEVRYKLRLLAEEEYIKIAARYPNSRVAALTRLALANLYLGHEDGAAKIEAIRQEIEQSYPDSVYVTEAQLDLAVSYSISADKLEYLDPSGSEQNSRMALKEFQEVLQLPDYLLSTSVPESSSIHVVAEREIAKLRDLLE